MKKTNFLLNKHFKLPDLRIKYFYILQSNVVLWNSVVYARISRMTQWAVYMTQGLFTCLRFHVRFHVWFACKLQLRFYVLTVKATADTKLHVSVIYTDTQISKLLNKQTISCLSCTKSHFLKRISATKSLELSTISETFAENCGRNRTRASAKIAKRIESSGLDSRIHQNTTLCKY
jgi:hypothetical protein